MKIKFSNKLENNCLGSEHNMNKVEEVLNG